MIRVSIIGANGYTGLELLTLLANHPEVKITHMISRSLAGTKVTDLYPSLDAYENRLFEDVDLDRVKADTDVAFLALPHTASANMGGILYRAGIKCIDLSADFRYKDVALYENWYKTIHPEKELLKQAVYGMPELYREQIRDAQIVGNPGCYTTCSILSLYPLLKDRLISTENIIIDAKSGTSGAGRKGEIPNIFCEVNENFKAYSVTTHRHTSEIEQELSIAANMPIALSFTPHLLPVQRGIFATIYANTSQPIDDNFAEKIANTYQASYAHEPFVRVLPEGVLPELKHVRHSNFIHIGYKLDRRLSRIIIVGVIDNLVKGASGQAIQNMNLMFGLDETTGLAKAARYL